MVPLVGVPGHHRHLAVEWLYVCLWASSFNAGLCNPRLQTPGSSNVHATWGSTRVPDEFQNTRASGHDVGYGVHHRHNSTSPTWPYQGAAGILAGTSRSLWTRHLLGFGVKRSWRSAGGVEGWMKNEDNNRSWTGLFKVEVKMQRFVGVTATDAAR